MMLQEVPFLDAIQDVSAGNRKVPQAALAESGRLAVVDQGRDLIAGYTDDETCRVPADGPLIVFGDHTRALKYVDFPFAMGADGTKVLRTREGFDTRFVYHYLRSRDIPSAGYSRHYKFLKDIAVPRPSPEEQRRIAAILDQTDALRTKRRQILAHLDDLTQSIFRDMFGDPDGAAASIPFADVATLEGGRNLLAADSSISTPFRVLKISAVTTGTFKPEESKPLPADYKPPHQHLVRSGDLLMSRANTTELVGAVALATDPPANLALPDKIWRFVWRDPASDPIFYHALFRTPAIRRRISRLSSGTGGSMKNVSKAKLESMPIPEVEPAKQHQFANLAGVIGTQRSAVRRALAADDELFASLQSRAFRGEL